MAFSVWDGMNLNNHEVFLKCKDNISNLSEGRSFPSPLGRSSGKVSAQPRTIVKQICFPNGNVLFLSLFSQFKN